MRTVRLDPTTLGPPLSTWFNSWTTRSKAANDKTVADRNTGVETKSDSVLREWKLWLLEHFFHFKCAYCEARIEDGEAEHFRPRTGVKDDTSGVAKTVKTATNNNHTGYYWLTHTWWNVLPSCRDCNSKKGAIFTIGGTRVFAQTELTTPQTPSEINTRELPHLLHPFFDTPEDHLVFGAGGVIAARNSSEMGRRTIEVCGLDRSNLASRRADAQLLAFQRLLMRIAADTTRITPGRTPDEVIRDVVDEYELQASEPGTEFGSAVLNYLRISLRDISNTMGNPDPDSPQPATAPHV